MRYGIFQDNQNTQYSRLRDQQMLGMSAAGQQGAYGGQYAANAGNIYGQQGNAQAAGTMGRANAWNSAIGNATNIGLGAYFANQANKPAAPSNTYTNPYGVSYQGGL
jgi:hypothetical protein